MARDDTISFEARVEHTTAKAYLVYPTLGGEHWLPKSQVYSMTQTDKHTYVFEVSEWWAKKNAVE